MRGLVFALATAFGSIATAHAQTELQTLQRGLVLVRERNCQACHQQASLNAPTLTDIGNRAFAGWIDAWLADPQKLRPHTLMPKMFTDDDRGQAERYAITMALTASTGPLSQREPKGDNAAFKRGEKLFLTTGCAACHANTPNEATKKTNEDDDPAPPYDPSKSIIGLGSPTGPQSTYALGAVGSKTTVGRLAEYLADPLKTNPHGRMPSMALTSTEAREIALYLTSRKSGTIPTEPSKPTLKPSDVKLTAAIAGLAAMPEPKQWVEVGRMLLTQKGCVNCHEVKQVTEKVILHKPLPATVSINGCLADSPDVTKTPDFQFNESDRKAIRAYLGRPATTQVETESFNTHYTLNRMMCLNCHNRDGEGGLSAKLADQMKQFATAESADDVRPPTLTQIGQKATPEWLKEVLLGKGRARPWLGLRMPQYGEGNVGHLVTALPTLDGAPALIEAKREKVDPQLIAAGRLLTGKDGYGCIACHDISGIAGGGTRGPDLAMTTKRVRSEWFDRWMLNPQKIAPGTKMPQYFLDGKATHAALGASPEKQIAALKAYFDLGPGLPLPVGLEPPKGLTIVVGTKPEIMRTFMPDGAGTRAIAVGYPGGVNVAYDGTNAKLAYAWSGPFLEMSPVWSNRGGNPAKLLGPKVWTAPSGASWTLGDQPAFEKIVTPEENSHPNSLVQYSGFSLNQSGQPTFRSTVRHATADAKMTIEETPGNLFGDLAIGLERQFVVNIPDGQTAWFQSADGMSGESLSDATIKLLTADGKVIITRMTNGPKSAKWQLLTHDKRSIAIGRLPGGQYTLTVKTWIVPRDDRSLIDSLK